VPENYSSLFNRIWRFVKITIETVKFIVAVIGIFIALGFAGVGTVKGIIDNNGNYIFWGIIAIIALIIILIIVIHLINKDRNFEVKELKRIVTYRYYPDGVTLEHTKFYKIISQVDKLKLFIDRYKWSCTRGTCKIHLLTKHQKLVEGHILDWNTNEIYFDPPIRKDEQVEVAIKWELTCEPDGHLEHFLSQIVERPTNYLELSVFLPYIPKEIKLIHFNSGSGIHSDRNTITKESDGEINPATGEIRYEIKNPKISHKYAICWKPEI
jgi:hypothetical protein